MDKKINSAWRVFRIGTRGSKLALAQAKEVRRALTRRFPKARFETVIIKTRGDEYQSVELFKKSGVGFFTKEIEKKLKSHAVDMAVHSLKDLPTTLPKGLILGAVPRRLPTDDVLVTSKGLSLSELPSGSRVGTGSLRRQRMLRRLRPDVQTVDLRGNLDTRIRKVVQEKILDGIILAEAGVLRLKKYSRYCRTLQDTEWLPAVGQGALGIEIRENDTTVRRMVKALNDPASQALCVAEREFLKTLHGGCRVPVGLHSQKNGSSVIMKAAVYSVLDQRCLEAEIKKPFKDSLAAGRSLAKQLLRMGAGKLLSQARKAGIS